MKSKAELKALIREFGQKTNVHAAIEATRLATARKEREPAATENRLYNEVHDLRTQIEAAIDQLPIE